MELQGFYESVAQLSLTLFGLWFVVVELRADDLLDRPWLRRTTLHVSLSFLVPGVVSLASLLAVQVLVVWRVAFAVGGLAGLVANVRLATSQEGRRGPVPVTVWWASAVLYGLFIVVAVWRPGLQLGDTAVPALAQEGLLVTVQLLLTAAAAWQVFTSRLERADDLVSEG